MTALAICPSAISAKNMNNKRKRKRKRKRQSNSQRKDTKKEINVDEFNQIESLPATNTVGLLQRVRAAIFLSLDELWSTPSDLVQIATILDPDLRILNGMIHLKKGKNHLNYYKSYMIP